MLYNESLDYISNELATQFASNYEKNLNPQKYIDSDDFFEDEYEQLNRIKKDYLNATNKFQDFGINVETMLEYFADSQKKVDAETIKKYIVDMNYIKDIRIEKNDIRESSDEKSTLVDVEALKEIYKEVTPQEREQYIRKMKKLKMEVKSIVLREDDENATKEL